MSSPEPIVPHRHSVVVVLENSPARLHVCTRPESGDKWFFGLPMLLALLGLTGWSLHRLREELAQGHSMAIPQALAQIFLIVLFFGGLAGFTFLREHLSLVGGAVEYTWRLLGFTLRRRRAPLAALTASVVESDESTASLLLQTPHWQARFGGSDIGPATLAAVLREIDRRRAEG